MREIIFYKTRSGGSPVEEFLDSLNSKQAQKATWVMQLVEEFDRVPAQYFKKLEGTENLWEVRVQDILRFLGFFDGAKFLVLCHAFVKKTRKISSRDIAIAEKRKSDYLNRRKKI